MFASPSPSPSPPPSLSLSLSLSLSASLSICLFLSVYRDYSDFRTKLKCKDVIHRARKWKEPDQSALSGVNFI
jgi:hypothetical protein